MRLTQCRRTVLVLCGVALCSWGYADVVLEEYNGYDRYPVGNCDYRVDWDLDVPSITILQPSDPGYPYDFECYDDPSYDPADIGAIIGTANIGSVEIMVRGHDDRSYGARDVYKLQFNQTGVSATIREFAVSRELGIDDDTYAASIAGPFTVASYVWSDMHIGTVASGAEVQITELGDDLTPMNLYVSGDIAGTLELGSRY
jgi:hypothetical protein